MSCVCSLCRPGFESELAAELMNLGLPGYVQSRPGQGLVVFHPTEELQPGTWRGRGLAFARQSFPAQALQALPAGDRVAPISRALMGMAGGARELVCESPDDDPGRELAGFLRAFAQPLRRKLEKAGWLRPDDPDCPHRAHVCFRDSSTAWAGVARLADSSPWPGGIPRLRFPRTSPSRSILKLDEGLLRLLSRGEREAWLAEGMRAVDLGAAPGGWTWLLLGRGMQVSAVDNGPLAPRVSGHDLCEHLREDGFAYRPEPAVDWMVCDMVEQPGRVARLVGRWLAEGWCRYSVFNLKLPMKKRYAEWRRCAEILEESCSGLDLRFKHLYHDREELTGFATRQRG